ncbi:A/G-specific adenine glycosylase [Sulfobacillus sp. hq2]|uniref:A/G-specific adenine glycosylase n=2 Tax=Sulfobacillus TaxID=28033 RepID=UPI001FA8DC0D|nr:A/G-specific adenine glycosylase [Sulfobacillus sp. hq2]
MWSGVDYSEIMKRIKYKADLDAQQLQWFQRQVLDWYRREGRDLPWRKTMDPYHIVVSEILLHQTTVKTVQPIYEKFLDTFPTIQDLAAAPLEAVKYITDPLGYKVRGSWLHQIAQTVVNDYAGQFPQTLEELLALPGIGRYTAGAVLSFAFGNDAPIVDTNVNRFIGRYFGIEYKRTNAEIQHQLWAVAEAIVPTGQAREFNNALMDMGAMVCTARKPYCLVCPVSQSCIQLQDDGVRAAEERVQYRIRERAQGS